MKVRRIFVSMPADAWQRPDERKLKWGVVQRIRKLGYVPERCGAGIFLFTKDDRLIKSAPKVRAVPRDNVVYEAGYFSAAKGKARTLILLQDGAKMPADLGGDIYGTLPARATGVTAAKPVLRKFVESL